MVQLPDFITDDRRDPFTGANNAVPITDEIHDSRPVDELGWAAGIKLFEYPRPIEGAETIDDVFQLFQEDSPGGGVYTTPFQQIDFASEPSGGQFKVSFNTSRAMIKMNASDLSSVTGKGFKCVYEGLGSVVEALYFYAIPPGSIIWFMELTGGWTITEMRQLGFAVMDGTTPLAQGINGALIVGATPDLITDERFIKPAAPGGSNVTQEDAVQEEIEDVQHGHGISDPGHQHDDGAPTFRKQWFNDAGAGSFNTHSVIFPFAGASANGAYVALVSKVTGVTVVNSTSLDFNSAGVRLAAQTRPRNVTAIPLLKVK